MSYRMLQTISRLEPKTFYGFRRFASVTDKSVSMRQMMSIDYGFMLTISIHIFIAAQPEFTFACQSRDIHGRAIIIEQILDTI